VSQVVFFMVKIIYLVMSNWFIAANVVATNSCASMINCKAKLMNSTAKPNNSIANRPNYVAKVMNSTVNRM